MIKEENLSQIGQFTKPHGIKGEISLITDIEIADISGEPYIVCNMDGIWVPFFVSEYRQKNASTVLITFENLDSADKVKFLMGKTAFVPSELLPPDEERAPQWKDLVGYILIDDQIGTLGKVIYVDASTLNVLLTVDYKGNEVLIPIALVTSIQHEQGIMNLSLPEGLLEI